MKILKRIRVLMNEALYEGDFLDFCFSVFVLSMSLLGFAFSILVITGAVRWVLW